MILRSDLGPYQSKVDARVDQWNSIGFSERLKRNDTTLWPNAPSTEVDERLGWLSLKRTMGPRIDGIIDLAREVREEGITNIVLLGMGGSSLAPCVFRRTFGVADGHPDLTVLDSTHPDAVGEVRRSVDPRTTLFIVSSKSGTTIETMSLYRYFWKETEMTVNEPGKQFIAVTDPSTPLARLAAEKGFRRVFEAPPDVGGRYSALSDFGLVPAALIGVDVRSLLETAFKTWEAGSGSYHNDGLTLGASLGELTMSGRDKITILASASVRAFPIWVEQLIAESTGKSGRGMVPIVGEPIHQDAYPPDRTFVGISLDGEERAVQDRIDKMNEAGHPTIHMIMEDMIELGMAMFEWELAIASAATIMGIDPFDQPDVQDTKNMARRMMSTITSDRGAVKNVETFYPDEPNRMWVAIDEWSSQARQGDYVSIQAYLAYTPEKHEELQQLREDLMSSIGVATTLGYGPRFLHSTGQLHKGGPNTGLFLQLVDYPNNNIPVPGAGYTFGELTQAEALGDYAVLTDRGRRVLRIDLGDDGAESISRLRKDFEAVAGQRRAKVIV